MIAIGLDLTSHPRAVAVDADGVVRASYTAAADDVSAVAAALDAVTGAGADPLRLGVATPAMSRPHPGVPDPHRFASRHDVPAGVAMVLGETWAGGAAPGSQHAVAFALGSALTAGVITSGRPVRGATDAAMNVEWLAVNPVERDDYRRYGGLAAEIAEAGIVRRLVWRVKAGDHSTVADRVAGDLTAVTAALVFAGARDGDGVARSVVRDTARYVGMAIANLVTLFDPDSVIVGGLLATERDLLLETVRVECLRRMHSRQGERLRLLLPAHGDHTLAIGAARAAFLTG